MAKAIKQKDGIYYYNKFPEWVRVKYFYAVNEKCQLCNRPMDYHDMAVHRVKRGHKGGLYTLCPIKHPKQNCMFVHTECHKKLHQGEPQRK